MKFFSIYDTKVGAYMQPFPFDHAANAIRSFTQAVNDSKTSLSKNPEDFVLFELASFDEVSGTFSNHKVPFSLGTGVQFLNKQQFQD